MMCRICSNVILLISFSFVLIAVESGKVDFIDKCKDGDRVCQTKIAQKIWPAMALGLPDLGIKTSDPLFIKSVKSNHAGLNIDFEDITLTGLKGCQIVDLYVNVAKKKFEIILQCKLLAVGNYDISGRILLLPVEGNGDCSISLQKLRIHIDGDLSEKTDEAGKNYINIIKFKHESSPVEPVILKFNNLFNGNKELSDALHTFVNENYKDVVHEVGGPILESVYKMIVKAVNKFMYNLPIDEYFLN